MPYQGHMFHFPIQVASFENKINSTNSVAQFIILYLRDI